MDYGNVVVLSFGVLGILGFFKWFLSNVGLVPNSRFMSIITLILVMVLMVLLPRVQIITSVSTFLLIFCISRGMFHLISGD